MKTNLPLYALSSILLLSLCGCQTGHTGAPPPVELSGKPVLFLPVLPVRDDLNQAAAETSHDLRDEARSKLGTRALFAADLTNLRNALASGNLQQDGTLNLSEIATLGKVADCGAVFVLQLAEHDPYMPQSLTGDAVVVDAESGRVLAERIVSLRLADPRVMASYRYYLETTRSFRVGNLESNATDRLHTALLSPTLFRRFATYAVVNDLFGGQESAPAVHLERGRSTPEWLRSVENGVTEITGSR